MVLLELGWRWNARGTPERQDDGVAAETGVVRLADLAGGCQSLQARVCWTRRRGEGIGERAEACGFRRLQSCAGSRASLAPGRVTDAAAIETYAERGIMPGTDF